MAFSNSKVTITIENDTQKRTIVLPSIDGSVEVDYEWDLVQNETRYVTNNTIASMRYTFRPGISEDAQKIIDITETKESNQ